MSRAVTGYLRTLIQKDDVLSAKVQAVLAGIRQRSGGKIGEGFLNDLMSRRVNEKYWDSK